MKPVGLYMFINPHLDSNQHRAEIDTPEFKMVVVGVPSFEEGARVAKQFVEKGVQIVELCGAFGYAGAKTVSEAVGDKASVGIMVHQVRNAPKLAKALEAWA
jgi:hypothetical protein